MMKDRFARFYLCQPGLLKLFLLFIGQEFFDTLEFTGDNRFRQ